MDSLEAERQFLLDLRAATRAIALGSYRRAQVERKADGTDVTAADRAAEQCIRERLARRFPADAVLGEEFGASGDPRDGRCWILDPIDGTTWFALGTPLFATLVALCVDGEPVLGLADFPALGESYLGVRGGGAWWLVDGAEPERVRVAAPKPLGEAFGSASGIHDTPWTPRGQAAAYDLGALSSACRRFRFCGDALQHMLVARGGIDLAVDARMAPWDSAALVPIVEEAGGVVADARGGREGVVFAGSLLAASHRGLIEAAVERLRLPASPG